LGGAGHPSRTAGTVRDLITISEPDGGDLLLKERRAPEPRRRRTATTKRLPPVAAAAMRRTHACRTSRPFARKTITISVGKTAGGYDLYSRLMARHLGNIFPATRRWSRSLGGGSMKAVITSIRWRP
jgi:hypothetical protein